MKRLLLHVCCMPCGINAIERLKQEYDVAIFFFNPNIWPQEEYEKRLGEVRRISSKLNIPLIEGVYDHKGWLAAVKGLEHEMEGGRRCNACFEYRLRKAAEIADKNFNFFTTTLTTSPHKSSRLINEIGKRLSPKFLEFDFKKKDGYRKSIELSKQHNIYRQNYCGCEFSLNKSIASPKE